MRDRNGKPYTVRYDAVNAMLLNEFLKEHTAIVEEQRNVQEQDATIARLEQQIEALTAGLQKVNAQLELTKSAPQTAVNNQLTLNPEVQTLFACAPQLLTVDETRISGLRSLEILNARRSTFAAQNNTPLCCSPKRRTERGTIERDGLDVNPARELHDQRPCSRLSRHSGREQEPPP